MKCNKLLGLGMAITLVCSSLPQMAVQTYGETVEEIAIQVSENAVREDENRVENETSIGRYLGGGSRRWRKGSYCGSGKLGIGR